MHSFVMVYNITMAKKLFWFILGFLLFGLIILSSASVVQATKQFGSSSYYWRHQLLYGVVPGLLVMIGLWKFKYQNLRPFALPLLFVALVLMILVFVPALGIRLKGATSWINMGWFTFQPAEVLKLALVIYIAAWLGDNHERVKNWQLGLLPFGIVMSFVALLLLLQPDLGTLGIVLLIAGGMYFIAGLSYRATAAIIALALVLIVGVAALSPHRWNRIMTVFNPSQDARGSGWQLNQALVAIGSGGMWGVGLGQSTQKFGFLPEPIGDSIFAVIVEELGLVGGLATVGMFAGLGLMLARVASRAPDAFGSLIASGMALWILGQAIINMMAITGIGPLTGLPLPFISYGGTSMIAMLAGLGIVLNIAEKV
jgi:cell division protein FtsW